MKAKIQQVEPQIARQLDNHFKSVLEDLRYHIPSGYRLRISLVDAKKKKKRSNAAADSWSPASDRAEVWFEPATSQEPEVVDATYPGFGSVPPPNAAPQESSGNKDARTSVHSAEADLLRTLDRAESRPGWRFVPLKKFRDEILPAERARSMGSDVERQEVLRSAIEKKLILIGKVPNPKSPQFPVTTIRLNRLMPAVKTILGDESDADLAFHPVTIKGEPLSATVIRERRR